ncbi:hypothetical protein KS18_13975 [Photorhabdus luminescens]|nr:hypothetical protein KS18_13975 [Photorhabdus luminescens]
MNIGNENIEFIDLDNDKLLVPYFSQISSLFLECFGRTLDKSIWEWAYIANPFGSPLVSVVIVDGCMVGHYAVIPMDLTNKLKTVKGYLSMTTMVSASYRRFGFFQSLAERVYDRITETGLESIVFGFPNNNSSSGFRKRLGWNISDEFKVVEVPVSEMKNIADFLENTVIPEAYTLSLSDPLISEWRCKKPGQSWSIDDGVGSKAFGNVYDLMYLSDPAKLAKLSFDKPVNIILPFKGDNDSNNILKVAFPYRFGYRCFNMQSIPDFFVQMCMSDVF